MYDQYAVQRKKGMLDGIPKEVEYNYNEITQFDANIVEIFIKAF